MNDSLWRRARDIFEQAIEMDESRQMTFVHQACGADHSLLAEVKKMIAADRRHNSLLDQPIFHWEVITETTAEKRPGAPPFNYIGNESPLSPVALDTKPPAPSRKAFLSRSALLLAIIMLLLGGGGWWAFSHFKRSPDAAVAGDSSSNSQANLPRTASAPDAPPSTPASRPPDLKVELEQEGKGVVSPEARFKSGAGVRLIASPNQSGRFYIVMKGTVGHAVILYPDSRIRGSRAAVRANQRVEMPPSKSERPWFRFDKRPGVETLYIVFAMQNDDESLQSLESPIRETRRRLKKAEEQQTLSALEALASGQSASTTVAVKKILLRHEK